MIRFDKKKMEDHLKFVMEFVKNTEDERIRNENVTVQKQNKNS